MADGAWRQVMVRANCLRGHPASANLPPIAADKKAVAPIQVAGIIRVALPAAECATIRTLRKPRWQRRSSS
jgi:hypothetical protein